VDLTWYGSEARRYRNPIETIEAVDRDAVAGAWRRAEAALADGYSIAGYVAYEAGYAEHPVAPAASQDEPLVALGVFTAPEPIGATSEMGDRGEAHIGPLVATIDRARYEADLEEIARVLRAGDAYQVNYTVPFAFLYTGDAAILANCLRARARVPYAAFVRYRGHAIVSLSPELFFRIDGDRIETRPMKGTAEPSGALDDAKNRAEHIMIVDLLRNDLHRICGDVTVEGLLALERYPSFATRTSTIAGRLAGEHGLGAIFAALFPCGSITGAPKRAAMATIARLEAAPRRIAMGAIGYCDAPRHGVWNVAIRTAILDERTRTGEVRIGGGIVAGSLAPSEWAEILIKRRAFATLAAPVGLFETIGVTCDGAMPRAEAHLARLERSAFAFGIRFDPRAARDTLAAARATHDGPARLVRLALTPDGTLSIASRAYDPVPECARACIAEVRLDAYDPTLRHKTSERRAYDAASASAKASNCFDALLLNQHGRLADGARTTIFLVDANGRYATPPLADGALAGILRAEMLASGSAYEAPLHRRELANRSLVLGNAARGLFAVTLLPPSRA